ncbi:hypothetical protein [Tabrizicola sp.]|uniref:hypothetical protein n=1 Tax=Tabrizicola sp. TaxID=2005166 RepID=UPI003F3C66B8
MMSRPVAIVAVAVWASPAVAFEALTFGDFTLTPEVGANLMFMHDSAMEDSTTGYLDLTLVWSRQVGSLTFGVEAFSEIVLDTAEDRAIKVFGDPYIDLGLWLEGERFGYLAYSYTSSAIGEHCIEAPTTGENIGAGDYVTIGTCPAFDSRSVLFYRTPDLGGGLKLAASYMPETGFESVESGEATSSASLALIYEREAMSGAIWTGSLGMEKVLAVEGGGPEAVAYQAGLNWTKDGWTIGGAVALTDNGDWTEDSGFGLGVSREVTDKLTLSTNLNVSQSRAAGARLDETSIAVIGMYSFVPDKVIADMGVWHIRSDDAGAKSNRSVVSIGMNLYF